MKAPGERLASLQGCAMSPWQRLSAELDAWQVLGREATLWWRDDDAVTATPALQRLLSLARDHAVPLSLAVIPAHAQAALANALELAPRIAVLQHGYAHKNHAAKGDRAIELGGQRRRTSVGEELQRGWRHLAALMPGRVLAVMVPPWNRVAPELLADLPGLGFRALSTFSARSQREAAPGLLQTNCHADLIDWRGNRGFRGEQHTIGQLCDHLRARRGARADAGEASGILSHHLVHDDACWRFLADLFELCNRHPAVRWLEAREACLGP
jgi:hypothetical protein